MAARPGVQDGALLHKNIEISLKSKVPLICDGRISYYCRLDARTKDIRLRNTRVLSVGHVCYIENEEKLVEKVEVDVPVTMQHIWFILKRKEVFEGVTRGVKAVMTLVKKHL